MTTKIERVAAIAAAALFAGASPVLGASAKSVEDFYKGRTMTVIASVGAGPYDLYARVLSMHIARHIPGSPSIIVQNMAGAGGLKAANYAYNVAARDGSVLLAPLKPTPLAQLMRKDVKYDAAKFQWLGNLEGSPPVLAVPCTPAPNTGYSRARTRALHGNPSATASQVLAAWTSAPF